jgi:hypothetical protein
VLFASVVSSNTPPQLKPVHTVFKIAMKLEKVTIAYLRLSQTFFRILSLPANLRPLCPALNK